MTKSRGLKVNRAWTAGEEYTLSRWYDHVPMPTISRVLGRSRDSIRGKARVLGLHMPNRGRYKPVPVAERFWDNVDKSGDCWLWLRTKGRKGYGLTTEDGRTIGAHRVAWKLTFGPIPSGLYVCHSCDNPPCVNPAHLWLGTNQDNQLDALRKGRYVNRRNQWSPRV